MDTREEYMTVVFKTNARSFEKNPLHIKSEFGDVAAVCRGDALEELEALKQPPMSEDEAVEIIGNECFGLLAMSSDVRPFIVSKSKSAYRALIARWGQ